MGRRKLDCVDPSTPCRWRGNRLGHHGWIFFAFFCVMAVVARLKFVVCKKMVQNNLRDKVILLLSVPHWRAPLFGRYLPYRPGFKSQLMCTGVTAKSFNSFFPPTPECVIFGWIRGCSKFHESTQAKFCAESYCCVGGFWKWPHQITNKFLLFFIFRLF